MPAGATCPHRRHSLLQRSLERGPSTGQGVALCDTVLPHDTKSARPGLATHVAGPRGITSRCLATDRPRHRASFIEQPARQQPDATVESDCPAPPAPPERDAATSRDCGRTRCRLTRHRPRHLALPCPDARARTRPPHTTQQIQIHRLRAARDRRVTRAPRPLMRGAEPRTYPLALTAHPRTTWCTAKHWRQRESLHEY
jgi:hypothetical protein